MDSDRFDRLARTLAHEHGRSRRGVLRTAAGGLLVGLWAAVRGSEGAQAQIPPPLCPEWVLARYPWLCEGNERNPAYNDADDNDKDNKKDKDKDGPCAGKADRECCGGADSGQWCQGGNCVTPTGSLADCQGLCGDDVTICGQTVTCASCGTCESACAGGIAVTCAGPLGEGFYCVRTESTIRCRDGCGPGEACCGELCQPICT